MPRTVVAQISDPHIPGPDEEGFTGANPRDNLRSALAHAARRCESVVISGDLARVAGTDAEYEGLAGLLTESQVPVHLCAGNHDESTKIRRLFGVSGRNERCDYAVAVSHGNLVILDTSRAGREEGEIDPDQAEWLAGVLADGEPALVVMHHPVVAVGGPALASITLDADSRRLLADAIAGANVVAVTGGHAHLTCSAVFAGVPAYVCPSSAYEFGFGQGRLLYRPGPAQYMEFSWGPGGRDFLARVVTVVDDSEWLVME